MPVPEEDTAEAEEDVDNSGVIPLLQEFAVVRRLCTAMRKAMEPSPLPANKHLTREEAERLEAEADKGDLAIREHRLAVFTEFVLDMSVRPVRDILTELSANSEAVDAIPIRTYARRRQANGPVLSTDPDAGWHVREDHHPSTSR